MHPVRLIGLDPGLRHTGWGVIEVKGNSLSPIAQGVIDTPTTDDLAQRLNYLYQELIKVIELHSPNEAAVEETFVNKNPASTLKLGMARGVILLAPAMLGLSVAEYSANKVKKSVVGVGHAGKDQVLMMVQRLLPTLSAGVRPDAADALAVAICHAHHRQIQSFILTSKGNYL